MSADISHPPRMSLFTFQRLLVVFACLAATTVWAAPPKGPGREHFVPVDQLDTIFRGKRGGIMLPREEFQELLKRAQLAEQQAKSVPAAVVIRSATYEVAQADNHAVVTVAVDIEQFADHWTKVKIPLGNLQLEAATIDGSAATVGRDPTNTSMLTLVRRQAGRFTLTLQLSTPLATTGSDRVAAFRVLSGAATSVRVQCPQDRHLEVNDLQLQRPAPVAEDATYIIPAGTMQEVRLKWTAKRQQTKTDTLVFGRTATDLVLTADTLRWDSTTRISVFGGTINELWARVPGHLEVTSVESAGLESWKLEDDPDRDGYTRLKLNYRQPFSDDRIVQLAAVTPLTGSQSAQVPTLEYLKTTSHSGRLTIQQADQLRLMATVSSGIRHIGTNRVSSNVPASEVFDFWIQDYQLAVAVKPRDRELFAQANSTVTFDGTSAGLVCELTIETLNAPLFELTLQLPDGWQTGPITSMGKQPVKWREGSDSRQVIVEPVRPVAPGQLLTLKVPLSQSIDDPVDAQTIALPVVTAVDTTLVGGTYKIAAASDLMVTPLETTGLTAIGDDAGTLLFETQSGNYSGSVSIVRKPARLASRAVLKSWMDTRLKTVEATITVDVVHGTTRTLELELPQTLGEELRFQVLSIRQVPGFERQQIPTALRIIEQSPRPVAKDVRTFELTFDRRFQGAVTLRTTAELPRDDTPHLATPFVRVADAVRQHGLVCFEAYPEQELRPETGLVGLKPTDSGLVETPHPSTGRRTALVYRYIKPDYALTVAESRFKTLAVPSAVCEEISNISVLSESGTIQRAASVHFKCSGVQTLRFQLPNPDHSYLWSTILNGDAVEVRTDGDAYLVAVPTDRQKHHLEILFESAAPSTSLLGQVAQQSLQLSIDTEQGQARPIDILEQTWEIRYPRSAMLVGHDGAFVPQQGIERPGWLQKISSLIRLPGWDRVYEQAFSMGIFCLVLLIVTALIARRSWIKLLGFAGVCVVALSVLSVISRVSESLPSAMYLADSGEAGDMDMAASAEFVDEALAVASPDSESDDAAPMAQTRPPAPTFQSGVADADPFGGGGIGGDFNGGFGSGRAVDQAGNGLVAPEIRNNTSRDDFSGQVAGLPPSDMVPQGGPAGLQSHTIRNRSQNGAPTTIDQMLLDGRNNADLTVPDPIRNIQILRPNKPSGAARLSIRATVASPADYQARQFRSISGASDAAVLQLIVQNGSRLNSLRSIAAATVMLLFLLFAGSPLTKKTVVTVIVLLAAVAAVPIVPNQWQSVVDGVFFGALGGVALWVVRACVCKAVQQIRRLRSPRRSSTAVAGLLLVMASTAHCQAQQPQHADHTGAGPDVVLPYSPDGPPLLADRIFLSRDDFLKLYRQANPDELETPSVPANDQVVAADYRATDRQQIENTRWSQRFRARYVIRTHTPNASVSLPIGSVAIRTAKLDGTDALLTVSTPLEAIPLINFNAGQQTAPVQIPQRQQKATAVAPIAIQRPYTVLVPAPGLHVLDIEFDIPAIIENSVGRIDLPLSPVPAGTLTYPAGDQNFEFRVNGRSNTFRRTNDNVVIPIDSAKATRIEWRPATANVGSDVIYHATVNSAWTINDAGLTHHAAVLLNCRQGNVSEIDVTLPPEFAVRSVDGDHIASWQVSEENARLKVQFQQPVESSTAVHLTLFRQIAVETDEQLLHIAAPAVVGASRDSGNVTVLAGRELEVRVESLSGVTQQNAANAVLPEGADAAIRRVLAWRYTRHPMNISVRVFRTPNRLVVNALSGVQVEPQRQLWTTLIEAHITGTPRRRLEIEVPTDYLALEVTGNDLADWYFSHDDDPDSTTKLLNLQFAQARTGKVNAVIRGQTARGPNADTVELQPLRVRNAGDSSRAELSVWLDAASTIRNFSADKWRKSGSHASVRKLRTQLPAISFAATGTTWGSIEISLDQVAAASVCESVTVTNVTDTSVELTLALKWQVSDNAAVRELVFTLPAALADIYDFQVPGLRQIEKTVTGDEVRFNVHLQRPISRQAFILGTGTLPLPESRQIRAQPADFTVPADSRSTITSQSHYWVIVNQSSGLLAAADPATDGTDIAAADISTNIPKGFLDQSVAIRRLHAERPNSPWELRFPQQHEVSPAVVALAAHTTVIAEDGTWRSRHQLTVRNEARQFLPVMIPADSRFLYCLVANQPTRIVSRVANEQTLYLIPIPQSGESSTPFDVQFALTGQAAFADGDLGGKLIDIPAPAFPEYRDVPAYGITVSRNTWSVYVPEKWHANAINDPRQTNVIGASVLDFQDASLMCAVDNSRSMINSLKSNQGRGFVDNKLIQNLNEQVATLNTITGNTAVAEQQRQETLTELYSTLEPLSEQQQRDAYPSQYDITGTSQIPVRPMNDLGNNIYLDASEENTNRFNYSNNADFITSNGTAGIAITSEGTDFNFKLPDAPQQVQQELELRRSLGNNSAGTKRGTLNKQRVPQKPAAGRSQLLEQRKSNRETQLGRAQRDQSDARPFGLSINGREMDNRRRADVPVQPPVVALPGMVAAPIATTPQANEPAQQAPRRANVGQLSLNFTIPEDGIRHDFTRTTGNPILALHVRDATTVEMGLGLIWAVICGIVAVILIRSMQHSQRNFASKCLIVIVIAAFAGWILLPAPLQTLSLVICCVGLFRISFAVVMLSFRQEEANTATAS